MKQIFLGILALTTYLQSNSQKNQTRQVESIRPLDIGDKCPDITFTHVLNSPDKTISLSGFKGKMLILDFWSTWCTSCISAFPKLDSLQKKFGDQIQILPIADQQQALQMIPKFWNSNKITRQLSLPTIIDDKKLLEAYLPKTSVPHEVWIDGNGIIFAITESRYITEKNIRLALSGQKPFLPRKEEKAFRLQGEKPFLVNITQEGVDMPTSGIYYSSTFSDRVPGLPSTSIGIRFAGNRIRAIVANSRIDQLYKDAFFRQLRTVGLNPNYFQFLNSRIVLEVKDSTLFYWPGKNKEDWPEAKTFCYELILPIEDSSKLFSYMQKDLDRIFSNTFGIKGTVEKRRIKCWALVRTSGIDKIHTGGSMPKTRFRSLVNDTCLFINQPIGQFLYALILREMPNSKLPIIDKTGYTANVDLDFTGIDLSNMQNLKDALKKYDLDFIETEEELELLVISDVDK